MLLVVAAMASLSPSAAATETSDAAETLALRSPVVETEPGLGRWVAQLETSFRLTEPAWEPVTATRQLDGRRVRLVATPTVLRIDWGHGKTLTCRDPTRTIDGPMPDGQQKSSCVGVFEDTGRLSVSVALEWLVEVAHPGEPTRRVTRVTRGVIEGEVREAGSVNNSATGGGSRADDTDGLTRPPRDGWIDSARKSLKKLTDSAHDVVRNMARTSVISELMAGAIIGLAAAGFTRQTVKRAARERASQQIKKSPARLPDRVIELCLVGCALLIITVSILTPPVAYLLGHEPFAGAALVGLPRLLDPITKLLELYRPSAPDS